MKCERRGLSGSPANARRVPRSVKVHHQSNSSRQCPLAATVAFSGGDRRHLDVPRRSPRTARRSAIVAIDLTATTAWSNRSMNAAADMTIRPGRPGDEQPRLPSLRRRRRTLISHDLERPCRRRRATARSDELPIHRSPKVDHSWQTIKLLDIRGSGYTRAEFTTNVASPAAANESRFRSKAAPPVPGGWIDNPITARRRRRRYGFVHRQIFAPSGAAVIVVDDWTPTIQFVRARYRSRLHARSIGGRSTTTAIT